jgi:hypothetical protein
MFEASPADTAANGSARAGGKPHASEGVKSNVPSRAYGEVSDKQASRECRGVQEPRLSTGRKMADTLTVTKSSTAKILLGHNKLSSPFFVNEEIRLAAG